MAEQKKHIVLCNLHWSEKHSGAKDHEGNPVKAKKWSLEKGQACPPELVDELKKLGHVAPEGSKAAMRVMIEPNFSKAVRVGEAGDVGIAKSDEEAAEAEEPAAPAPAASGKKGR